MKSALILGGTQFIGRNLVERMLGIEGFAITLFNRGRTGGELFPGVERIIGDRRTKEIERIASKDWDIVVDLSCYFPDDLKSTLRNLKGRPERYVFVSTCSVYEPNDTHILRNEEARVLGCTRAEYADDSPATYGNRKAECERILAASGLDHVVFRPALVYGPYDPTDRLYYWLHQVKCKDELLLPDNGERKFSVTYVQDLVRAIVRSMEQPTRSKVYNTITVPETSIGEIVRVTSALLQRSVPVRNASPSFLKGHGVRPWLDMPLWIDGDHFTYSNQRIKDELGLVPTDRLESIRATLDHFDKRGWPQPGYGMSDGQRRELLGLCARSMD
ncbi:MAG: NAD-dependent epimerase/dehydratase family protein [Flavobacteriales bacterium]|nr:MAG: NAD-dependent epimerase/dehydratase family protein [Flavobacteriales bacterium]